MPPRLTAGIFSLVPQPRRAVVWLSSAARVPSSRLQGLAREVGSLATLGSPANRRQVTTARRGGRCDGDRPPSGRHHPSTSPPSASSLPRDGVVMAMLFNGVQVAAFLAACLALRSVALPSWPWWEAQWPGVARTTTDVLGRAPPSFLHPAKEVGLICASVQGNKSPVDQLRQHFHRYGCLIETYLRQHAFAPSSFWS